MTPVFLELKTSVDEVATLATGEAMHEARPIACCQGGVGIRDTVDVEAAGYSSEEATCQEAVVAALVSNHVAGVREHCDKQAAREEGRDSRAL